ncbi:hypothetical protein pb186bvf_005390 [Paramecium bursaria]
MIKIYLIFLLAFSTLADYKPYCQGNLTSKFTLGNLTLYWRNDSTTMYFGANYSPQQWFALGVYTTGNVTADVWNFQISNNNVTVTDQYIAANGTWLVDSQQNLTITGLTLTSSGVSVNFQRPLIANDWADIDLNPALPYNVFLVSSSGLTTNTTGATWLNGSTSAATIVNSTTCYAMIIGTILIMSV